MKIDSGYPPLAWNDVPKFASSAEAIGFDGIWTSETQHDPFIPLALLAEHTEAITLGTAVAIAFARNPATIAYTAWDLANLSRGRFILGLGTQVKAHIVRRFGMPWPESPVNHLREFVAAIRAFWHSWQTGEKMNFRGDQYKLTLMTPFFNPGKIDYPDIPIYLAGVNPGMCRLAGEIGQGFHTHPLHSVQYLERVILPAIAEGADNAERNVEDIALTVSSFVVTDQNEELMARNQIAFYASTPSYRPVFQLHGWDQLAEQLSQMARRGEWMEMSAEISDEILQTFAVVAAPGDLGQAMAERYKGLAARVIPYTPYMPGANDSFWSKFIQEFKNH
jgi:probable F420-dependent oxidoreductase